VASAAHRDLDSLRNPTDGYRLGLDTEYLGGPFGGDVDAIKAVLSAEFFLPLYENEEGQRHVLELNGAVGWERPHSGADDIFFYERYRAGGISQPFPMRGFDFWGMGPHQSGEAVGGEGAVVINADYVFPIYEQFDARLHESIPILKGVVFFDQGMLESKFHELEDGLWRMSTGVGIRFRIPIPLLTAPLEMYYGIPLVRARDDERESFTLNFSTRF
jgi:outer membrane protein assembly factor BamA